MTAVRAVRFVVLVVLIIGSGCTEVVFYPAAVHDVDSDITGDADVDATDSSLRDAPLVPPDLGTTDGADPEVGDDTDSSDVGNAGETGSVCPPPVPDGDYFCALSASLDRAVPLHMRMTFTVSDGVLTTDAQPIASDLLPNDNPRPEARTDLGDPLPRITQPFGADGSFTLRYDDVEVLAEANSLTFTAIRVNLLLVGRFYDDAIAHGSMDGEVLEPTNVSLDNSTFACQRADDMRDVNPVYYNNTIAELVEPCD